MARKVEKGLSVKVCDNHINTWTIGEWSLVTSGPYVKQDLLRHFLSGPTFCTRFVCVSHDPS